MNRPQVSRTRILIIAVLTILTIGSWIGTEIYQSLTTDQVTPQVEKELTPLQTTFNLSTLDEIEQKREIKIDFTQPLEEQFQVPVPTVVQPQPEDLDIQFAPEDQEPLPDESDPLSATEDDEEVLDNEDQVDSP